MSIPNAIEYEGHLIGGQPSASQYKELAMHGYKTVISMRAMDEPGAQEAKAHAEEAGLNFISIPVASQSDYCREKAEALKSELEGQGPFVIHCKSGGRVAALFTLKCGWCDGKSVTEAIAEGEKLGLGGMENTVRMLLR